MVKQSECNPYETDKITLSTVEFSECKNETWLDVRAQKLAGCRCRSAGGGAFEGVSAGWCITDRNQRCGLVVQLAYELGVGLAEQLWLKCCYLGSYMFCIYTQTFGLIRNS